MRRLVAGLACVVVLLLLMAIVTTTRSRRARSWPARATLTHDHQVFSLAFSPDSALLATQDGAETVTVWNLATGRPSLKFSLSGQGNFRSALVEELGATAVHRCLLFSPDNRILVVGTPGSHSVPVFDSTTGQKLSSIPIDSLKKTFRHARFSTDGNVLIINCKFRDNSEEVSLWDTKTWQVIRTAKLATGEAYATAILDDGATLATTEIPFTRIGPRSLSSRNGTLRVSFWNTITGKEWTERQRLLGPSEWFISVALSGDGRSLAGGDTIWDLESGKALSRPLATMGGYHYRFGIGFGHTLPFSADGSLLATVLNHEVGGMVRLPRRVRQFLPVPLSNLGTRNQEVLVLWDVKTGQTRGQMPLDAFLTAGPAFSRDATLLATASGKDVVIWRIPKAD